MRAYIWLVLVLIVISYSLYAFVTADRSDDNAKIRNMVTDVASAIQERDLNGAISCVSKDYKDNSAMNYDRLRVLTAQALRVEYDYTIDTEIRKLDINGDTAKMNLHFVVTKVNGGAKVLVRDLTFDLRKENAMHKMIIPVKVWRVTGMEGLNLEEQTGI